MTERRPPGPRPDDDFYVPTPEELEEGGRLPKRRRRDRVRKEGSQEGTGRRRARGLFSRLRRGVGQKRTEAPAPTPMPSPPSPARREKLLKDIEDLKPSSISSPPAQTKPSPPSRPSAPVRPKVPEGKPVRRKGLSTSSGQRVRRITLPERKAPTRAEPSVRSPVPNWMSKRAQSLGHRLGPFRRRPQSHPQEQQYAAECQNCGLVAYALRTASFNYTLEAAGSWERLSGPASERRCSPSPGQ